MVSWQMTLSYKDFQYLVARDVLVIEFPTNNLLIISTILNARSAAGAECSEHTVDLVEREVCASSVAAFAKCDD